MTSLKRTLIAFAAFFAASSLDAQATVDIASQGLSPGDQLRITVWRKAELSCDCVIAANGSVIHPLYREVQVAGIPLSVVEDRLRTFLAKYEANPQFVIQPLVKIIIGGEIRSPNIYSVPPETTIAQAIALAGGANERGDLRRVKIVRDRQEISMDISRPDSDAGLLQIRSNDQLLIGRRRLGAREYIGPIMSSIAAVTSIAHLLLR